MQELADTELLRQYAHENSEAAFAELVTRHVPLVYSAALRKTGNPSVAEEVTQAVFIILARKARGLGRETALAGWLYQAARLTAANFLRTEIRRTRREQEAIMQSLSNKTGPETWRQIMPLLEDAMGRLGERERNAVVLRFFEGKSFQEVGAAVGASENAAKKRVAHALEKLRRFFLKHGVNSTAAAIGETISANSVHAVPVGLAKTVSAAALAKGAAASTSTLTLIKGALKIMAWTKAKTAIVVGASILLAAGTTTVTVKEVQRHENSKWDIGRVDGRILQTAPHIVRIIPSKFPNQGGWAGSGNGRVLGLGAPVEVLIGAAYGNPDGVRTIFPAKLPEGKYDFIANLPSGSNEALKQEIKKKFGIIARRETIETNVLFLRIKTAGAPGLLPTRTRNNSSSSQYDGGLDISNQRIESIINFLEFSFGIPVIDQTGLTGNYDVHLKWDSPDDGQHSHLKQSLLSQLGLEVVPGVAPVEMLVVEKTK